MTKEKIHFGGLCLCAMGLWGLLMRHMAAIASDVNIIIFDIYPKIYFGYFIYLFTLITRLWLKVFLNYLLKNPSPHSEDLWSINCQLLNGFLTRSFSTCLFLFLTTSKSFEKSQFFLQGPNIVRYSGLASSRRHRPPCLNSHQWLQGRWVQNCL